MTYPETIDYLYQRLPMFTRIGAAAIRNKLDNTLALCAHRGNPQHQFKSIHIAGTNGKGSTSHMLAAILQKAGYKTGLYTSPHLKDFRERIRINGFMVPESYVIDYVEQERAAFERIDPSFFEVTVAMAFSYFAVQQVDIAVIEVGLGGRLDSTNIISPELSVITNISFDHVNILGSTLPEIASEKAGIIKASIPVVIGERQPETEQVFIDKAAALSSEIRFASDYLRTADTRREGTKLVTSVYNGDKCIFKDLILDLSGSYQLKNLVTVLQAVITLNGNGFHIPNEAIYEALQDTTLITGLQGRWQILQQDPLVICDTGHNLAGMTEVLENINATPHRQLHMVVGMLSDKDVSSVLKLLPQDATYYFCQPALERAMPAAELAARAAAFGLQGEVYPAVANAIDAAKSAANPEDLIFIGGSTFVVAEAI